MHLIGAPIISRGGSYFTARNIRHLDEVLAKMLDHIACQGSWRGQTKLHLFHTMYADHTLARPANMLIPSTSAPRRRDVRFADARPLARLASARGSARSRRWAPPGGVR
jgi:hypothetical protein